MRILVVGAGGIGGYFGGRLKDAGRDVTFLVRARRAAQLAKTGLVIKSPLGDVSLPSPPIVMAETLREPFDLILLSCKAYDLASAVNSFAPAVGPNTVIVPVLNGMAHMDFLGARFGAGAVFGGQCLISTTLDGEGRIIHLNDTHLLSFGEQDGSELLARAGHRSGAFGCAFRRQAEYRDLAGDVGEVGLHRHRRRHHLPDAGNLRRYCRGRGGRIYQRHV